MGRLVGNARRADGFGWSDGSRVESKLRISHWNQGFFCRLSIPSCRKVEAATDSPRPGIHWRPVGDGPGWLGQPKKKAARRRDAEKTAAKFAVSSPVQSTDEPRQA